MVPAMVAVVVGVSLIRTAIVMVRVTVAVAEYSSSNRKCNRHSSNIFLELNLQYLMPATQQNLEHVENLHLTRALSVRIILLVIVVVILIVAGVAVVQWL